MTDPSAVLPISDTTATVPERLCSKCRVHLAVAGIVGLATLTTVRWAPAPLLIWNASDSSPIGLYAVASSPDLRLGDTALAWPPGALRELAAARGYLPARVPLVKEVAGIEGDRICAQGRQIRRNGRLIALRRSFDPSGRRMPSWSGCVRLESGDVFLLSNRSPLAFDGRYFGISRRPDVIGRASLLWLAKTRS